MYQSFQFEDSQKYMDPNWDFWYGTKPFGNPAPSRQTGEKVISSSLRSGLPDVKFSNQKSYFG
jgi:hypothetical protein